MFARLHPALYALLPVLIAVSAACGGNAENHDNPDAHDDDNDAVSAAAAGLSADQLPPALQEVFVAHGGLDAWRQYRTLSYSFGDSPTQESQTVDLYDRREYIKQAAQNAELGYDGEHLWIKADTSYQGNPAFYHNLMFYFYAMPWVLADEGIVFEEAGPLDFDGVLYPGFRVSYEDGVGLSPKDNYYLYYHPDTKQMRWLGYTVTYFSGEESKDVRYIEYPTWSEHGGVQLADSLVWYAVEEGRPTAPRGPGRVFSEVELDKAEADASTYAMPEDARLVEE